MASVAVRTSDLDERNSVYQRLQRRQQVTVGDGQERARHCAACVIQRTWRRFLHVRVYQFYRDFLSHRAKGDPAKLLKAINPREAQLLDKAAGIHLKFRLGGASFPPNIYYRIYTHRPVEDLCANSPKNYVAANTKQTVAKVHNLKLPGKQQSARGTDGQKDQSGWYQRWENNGWRRVEETSSLLHDPVTAETAAKCKPIHHDKARRREDVIRERKKRKIEWMVKLYKQGFVRDIDAVPGVERRSGDRGSPGLAQLRPTRLDGEEEEDDVDELLCWSADLDFDQYMTDWQALGTSGPSDLQDTREVERYSALLAKIL